MPRITVVVERTIIEVTRYTVDSEELGVNPYSEDLDVVERGDQEQILYQAITDTPEESVIREDLGDRHCTELYIEEWFPEDDPP